MAAKKKGRRKSDVEGVRLTLTRALIRKAAKIVGKGNFRYVAAQQLEINPYTWQEWIRVGRREIRDFAEGKVESVGLRAQFVIEIEKAEALCHESILMDVVESEDIRAKMWFLERRYNKMYSKNPNARIDNETLEETEVNASTLLAEKILSLLGEEE